MFTEKIEVKPSFDHRFDPERWSRGAGSMWLEFTLVGPLGAVTTSLNTGWMYEPLTEPPVEFGGAPRGAWSNPKRAVGKVGPDCISRHHEPPLAGPIACHAAAPPKGKEWFTEVDGCTLIEGGVCFGDQGYLVGDIFLSHLGQGGSEAGFAYLREIHNDWLAPEAPDVPRDPSTGLLAI
jgi:hypothetical protein